MAKSIVGFSDLLKQLPKTEKPPEHLEGSARVPCPNCNSFKSRVMQGTRYRWQHARGSGVKRRRKCDTCFNLFNTLEILDDGYTILLAKAKLFDSLIKTVSDNDELKELFTKVVEDED